MNRNAGFTLALALAFAAVLVGCSRAPSHSAVGRLESVEVLGERLPEQEGVSLLGWLDGSRIPNPAVRALARDMSVYRIETTNELRVRSLERALVDVLDQTAEREAL